LPRAGSSILKDLPLRFKGGETRLRRKILSAVAVMAFIRLCPAVLGQAPRPHHVPVIGKISGGSTHQAFSGKIASLDLKLNVLNVNAAEGGSTEIFPIKHNTEVRNAEGGKLRLKTLKPGTEVIVYYELKGSERTVKSIVVLSAGRAEEKEKKPSPPS